MSSRALGRARPLRPAAAGAYDSRMARFVWIRGFCVGALAALAACGAEGPGPDAGMDARADAAIPVIDATGPDAGGPEDSAAEASADLDAEPRADGGADAIGPADADPVTMADAGSETGTVTNPQADGGACAGSVCEGACVAHRPPPNTCGTAENLGTFCGDASCGSLCRATAYRAVGTRQGRTSAWFRASSNECSICSANLRTRITLAVPPGTDWDLFVHRPCGTVLSSSIRGAGEPDQIELDVPDRATFTDSFEYFIEVRYVRGSSCEPWTLTVEARGLDGTTC
jgi:hypothetical protein